LWCFGGIFFVGVNKVPRIAGRARRADAAFVAWSAAWAGIEIPEGFLANRANLYLFQVVTHDKQWPKRRFFCKESVYLAVG
jgi:hypothetical protein